MNAEPPTEPPNESGAGPFGKYFLMDKIAVGGMAEIFKAKTFGHGGFEHVLVVKRILPHIGENEEFVEMFIDEAKVSVKLLHANIIRIYDFGKTGPNYFIAMECVEGKDCRNILRKLARNRSWIPTHLAAFIAHEAARGLHYAHVKNDDDGKPYGIVHRDVSPSNVLVSYEGEAKIADFGIAKAESNAYQTKDGVLKGKFEYMSPEQADGEGLDARSDVFSLGIILWECLTGRRLFKGESETATLRKIKSDEIPPPSKLNPQVPEVLDTIVLKALTRDRAERYQSALELAERLRDYLYSEKKSPDLLRHDLADFMSTLFAEEIKIEKAKLQAGNALAAAYKEKLVAEGGNWEGQTNSTTTMGASQEQMKPPSRAPLFALAGLAAVLLLALIGGVAAVSLGLLATTPEPIAEVAPTTGSLDLLVVPKAKILVDGQDKGEQTNLSLADLSPGPHRVRFEASGYEPLDKVVDIQAGQTAKLVETLTAKPTEKVDDAGGNATPVDPNAPPVVTFKSEPAGATVKIDGQVLGKTPFVWEEAKVGTNYKVEYTLDGYDADLNTLKAKPGNQTDTGRLGKRSNDPGKLSVTLVGGGWANVYVDGSKLSKTAPLKEWSLPPGKHTIRVENAALGIDTTQDVKVDPGGSVTVKAAPK